MDQWQQDLAEKEKMFVMTDLRGYVASAPEDYFCDFGTKVGDWLNRKSKLDVIQFSEEFLPGDVRDENYGAPDWVEITRKKLERFDLANKLYQSVRLGEEPLRCVPYVVENYHVTEEQSGMVERVFLFKEDNNGTTYRIFDRK